jgi:hypothetical protein
MEKILFIKGLKQNVREGTVNLACVFMILLLTCACAGVDKKQASPRATTIDKVLTKGESENGEINDDQEIVCRDVVYTGSRLKRRVCATKAEWDVIDGKNRKIADDFDREVKRNDGVNTGSSGDSMGGQSGGMPH